MKPSGSKNKRLRVLKIWGLTGGIASGKSLAARFFVEAGIPVIDADAIARELRAPGGKAEPAIRARWGTSDPVELRKIIFNNPSDRKELEMILHPLIRDEFLNRTKEEEARGHHVLIYEASLLVETGRFREMDGLIVVSAPCESQIERLLSRDRCPKEEAVKILAAQATDAERRAHATFVIENSGSVDDLRAKVLALIPKLQS